jgi:hypothetical protein
MTNACSSLGFSVRIRTFHNPPAIAGFAKPTAHAQGHAQLRGEFWAIGCGPSAQHAAGTRSPVSAVDKGGTNQRRQHHPNPQTLLTALPLLLPTCCCCCLVVPVISRSSTLQPLSFKSCQNPQRTNSRLPCPPSRQQTRLSPPTRQHQHPPRAAQQGPATAWLSRLLLSC